MTVALTLAAGLALGKPARGLASYYSTGSITKVGEPFIPSRMTCAMRYGPWPRTVLVVVSRTGARARCRVNDSGPWFDVTRRIIDVSVGVKRFLHMRDLEPVSVYEVPRR